MNLAYTILFIFRYFIFGGKHDGILYIIQTVTIGCLLLIMLHSGILYRVE